MRIHTDSFVIDENKKIIYFHLKGFKGLVVDSDNCFICGKSPNDTSFNNEHIIPDWLLRKYNLYNKSITLPNQTKIPYRNYVIPCCQDCNTLLGREIESPISLILSGGYNSLIRAIDADENIGKQLFIWMCLLYIKTHLKDTSLLLNRDIRLGEGKIGDLHYWEDIHHIHCMARTPYSKAIVKEEVYGSIFIVPNLIIDESERFDYADMSLGKTVMLTLGDFTIFAVLNDSGAVKAVFKETFERITGPLSPFQLKDMLAHLVYINLNIKEKSVYQSSFSWKDYIISADSPDTVFLLNPEDRISSHGELLYFLINNTVPRDMPNRESLLKEVAEGKRQYLFDEKGAFIEHAI